ncbi:MAG: hypothetical protein CBE33_03955 [Candidatus Pelagibacter sp. TMED273]|nr:MAG: hypothetical protein CBE33_03955 [Candidatus Pelagibacter sp. TMED273]
MIRNIFIPEGDEKSTYDKLIIIIFYLFPLFLLSSFLMNLSLVIISIYFIFFVIRNKFYSLFENTVVILIIFFWIYLVFISFFIHGEEIQIIKSISYIRFIFLFLTIAFILPRLNFNLNKIFYFYLFIATIFSIDVIFQFIFGFNILGFPCEMSCQRNSSFFGKELVAGTFILYFGLIGLLSLLINNKNLSFFIIFLIFFGFSIFLTGDRTPFIIFLIIIFLNSIFNKYLRFYFISGLIISILFFSVSMFSSVILKQRYIENVKNIFSTSELDLPSLDQNLSHHENMYNYLIKDSQKKNFITSYINSEEKRSEKFKNLGIDTYISSLQNKNFFKEKNYEEKIFFSNLIIINLNNEINKLKLRRLNVIKVISFREKNNLTNKWYNNLIDSQYGAHYLTAISIFLDNSLFGAGLKSYRNTCKKYEDINSFSSMSRCSSHPHNLHLEILSEAGIFGYLFFIIIIFSAVISATRYRGKNNTILIYILLFLLSYVFPFKPSGSFFSTFNSFYFWLCISLIFYLKKKIQIDEK